MNIDRRTFLLGTLGAAGTLALSSCSLGKSASESDSGPAPRRTLRLAGGDFGFPSPFAYLVGPGYTRMSYLYDTLLWKDSTGQLIPWLASRFDRSSDGLTYTFELRDNVRWHDGRPLTPEDVVFTFQYFAGQRLAPTLTTSPRGVADVRAVGPRGVELRLQAPDVTFLSSQAGAVPIVPRHVWSAIPDASKAQEPGVLVGTGPYRLESYSRGQGAYLYTANDQYFLGKPFVNRLELRPAPDELSSLLAGELDAGGSRVTGVGPDALRPFQADDSYGIIENRGAFAIPLYWNLAKGGALGDVRFRQACAKAIDRSDLVRRLLGGNGSPGNPGYLASNHPFHVGVEQYPFDPAGANRLLDDAGYPRGAGGLRTSPDGRPLRFGVLVLNTVPAVVELVVSALKNVGVELLPRLADLGTLFGSQARGDFDMAISFDGAVGGDPDILRTLFSARAEGAFGGTKGYANAQIDDLAERQRSTFDEAERKRLVAEIQRIVARDVPALPLYYPTLYHVYKEPVFDQWYYTPGNVGGSGPFVYNKHVLITGQKKGLNIRPIKEGS
jgi:peptide/nickel transport system substrate-binding protein